MMGFRNSLGYTTKGSVCLEDVSSLCMSVGFDSSLYISISERALML